MVAAANTSLGLTAWLNAQAWVLPGWKTPTGAGRRARAPSDCARHLHGRIEAAAASCFKRKKPSAASAATPVSSPLTPTPAAPQPSQERGRTQVRKTARQQRKDRYAERKKARLEAQAKLAQQDVESSEELFVEFSWRQRKAIAISTYASVRAIPLSKTEALFHAAIACRVSWRTVHNWIAKWRRKDGTFEQSKWGKSPKVPSYFLDAEVRLKAAKWWRSRQPKQGAIFFLSLFLLDCCR